MKILKIRFQNLRNEAHFSFLSFVKGLFTNYHAVAEQVTDLLATFTTLLNKEDAVVDLIRKSDYTQAIADADQRLDRDIVGVSDAVNSSLHHFDRTVVEAAQSLRNLLNNYGKITKKSYEEELVAVAEILQALSGSYSAKVATLGLGDWVTELMEAAQELRTLLESRVTEQSEKPQERMKDVRREIDPVYHNLVAAIEAHALVEGEATYTAFANELNVAVTTYNNLTHHALKDIKHTSLDSIANQQYSGRAITPIPDVFFEGKKLAFAKDFTLTYKNNIEVGTATLTVHGKGGYKGTKVTTFNIARV